MKIMSTHCERKDIYEITWLGPNREYTNDIDYLLVDKKFQSVQRT